MRHCLILGGLSGLLLVLTHFTVLTGPFIYDEADYMHAARLGVAANFLDRPAMPIRDFIRIGLSRGREAGERHALSESIRASDDIPFYRHWHGPMYYYWLILVSFFTSSDDATRYLSAFFPILTMALCYFGSLWLTPGREGEIQGLLCAALFGFSVTTAASMEIAPHQLFVFWSTAALILLAKTVATGERVYFYAAIAAAAIDFATLEMTLMLLGTMLACVLAERRALQADWRFALRCVALFLGGVLLSWPGAILKLSFLKSYLGMGYLIVFRRDKSPWGHVTLGDTWRDRLHSGPLEFLLIALALIGLWLGRGLISKRYLYPFLIYAALMLLATGLVPAGAPRYALTFMPPLEFITGAVLASWLARRPAGMATATAAALSLALFAVSFVHLFRPHRESDPYPSALVAYVRQNGLERSTLLAPYGYVPTIHYYFPQTHLRAFEGRAPTPTDLEGRRFDGVIYPGYPIRFERLPRPLTR